PRNVPARVVDELEAVDVREDDRERQLVTPRAVDLRLELLGERAPVEAAGEGVRGGELLEALLIRHRGLEDVRLLDRRHRRADHRLGELRVGAGQGRILARGTQEEHAHGLLLHGERQRHGGAGRYVDPVALPPHALVGVQRVRADVLDDRAASWAPRTCALTRARSARTRNGLGMKSAAPRPSDFTVASSGGMDEIISTGRSRNRSSAFIFWSSCRPSALGIMMSRSKSCGRSSSSLPRRFSPPGATTTSY